MRALESQVTVGVVEPVARLIIEARVRHGFSQKRLAELLGVSQNTVSNWETGTHSPRLHLAALRELLDLDENLRPAGSARARDLRAKSPNELVAILNSLLADLNSVSSELSFRLAQGELEGSQAPRHAHELPGVQYYTVARDEAEQPGWGEQANARD